MNQTFQKIVGGVLAVTALMGLSACGSKTEDGDKAESIKVGFICLHDENSTYDKNFIDAAKAACKNAGLSEDQYIIKTNIPEGQECYNAAAELVDAGCNVVFADSFGHEDFMIQAAKDFIRFIYTDEDLMRYTLGTLPVNNSITQQYQDEIWMLRAYGANTPNTVDNIRNNLGWQGVRDVFYRNIHDLLLGSKSPAEVAAAIDQSCNAALEQGRVTAGGAS